MTANSEILVSVVSPVANGASWIESYIYELSTILEAEFKDFEIVLVDNASTDQTVEVIEKLQQQVRNIQLYCLARPIPYESVFVVALEQAIGDIAITLDPAYDPVNLIIDLIQLSPTGVDIVYGLRNDRLRSKFNLYHWLSKIFFKLYRVITKENLPIAASTLRLYTRRAINSFLDNSERYSLFPVIAAFSGLRYRALNYERINRTGISFKPSYTIAILKAFRLIFLSSYYPLRFLSFFALTGALLNVMYSIYVIVINIFKAKVAEGWTTLSLQNSVMFFILFVILAILSEYISRLLISSQNRPFYLIVKESKSLVLLRKSQLNVFINKNIPDSTK
jgi:glycosyltransferase involved in cell wall biosynthesis